MRNIAALVSVIAAVCIGLLACSSDYGSTGYGVTGYGATTPSPATNSGVQTLTVMNFLSWCSVAVNDGTASTGALVTSSVTPGSVATIVATPASGSFQIGSDPWFGVDQNDGGAASGTDVGRGTSETSTATVTIGVGATQCVSVCCQEPGNAPIPCPTMNPCP
jgi:hypothetical protein